MKRDKKKGFTLIELLIVIAILALIMIIVFVSANAIGENANYQGTTISKENVLKAASNYAYEYLIDSNVWYDEINSENKLIGTYCIDTKTLVDYGFLPKEVNDNQTIKITKDPYETINTQFITSEDDCDNSIPIISIDISDNTEFYEVANFTITLSSAVEGGKITYKDFYYTIYDSSDNEITRVDCGENKTTCSGSFNTGQNDNYYGNYKVVGYVGKSQNNYDTVERNFKINKLNPTITFTTTGTEGNNGYYISNITVNTNTDDDSKYTRKNLCVHDSDIGSDPTSDEWNNCTKEPTNLDESYDSKYVCVRYSTNSGNKYRSKCQQYRIDTTLPTVSITSGSYSSSKVYVNATVTGDYSDGVKYKIVDYSTSSSNACSDSGFTSLSSTTITASYSSNVNKAIWLKDNAGNCKKLEGFGVGNDSSVEYIYNDNSVQQSTISADNTINKIHYSNSFNGEVTYSINSNKLGITIKDYPVYYDSEYVSSECRKSANSYSASQNYVCSKYTCDSTYHKVSGSKCTYGSLGSSYTAAVDCIGDFYCTCKNGNCLWSYKIEPNCTYTNANPDGSCYDGWYTYSATNNNPSLTSCSVSESNGNAYNKSYMYRGICKWNGDYDATCTSGSYQYYCNTGDYLSGSKCYYCSDSSHELSGKYCYSDCSYTYDIYSYGRYAVLYEMEVLR